MPNSSRRKGIKCVFIINRSKSKEDNSPNTTRDTLIEHLEKVQFNNFLIRNRDNILEVDLIEGRDEENNKNIKIFNYIYNDSKIDN